MTLDFAHYLHRTGCFLVVLVLLVVNYGNTRADVILLGASQRAVAGDHSSMSGVPDSVRAVERIDYRGPTGGDGLATTVTDSTGEAQRTGPGRFLLTGSCSVHHSAEANAVMNLGGYGSVECVLTSLATDTNQSVVVRVANSSQLSDNLSCKGSHQTVNLYSSFGTRETCIDNTCTNSFNLTNSLSMGTNVLAFTSVISSRQKSLVPPADGFISSIYSIELNNEDAFLVELQLGTTWQVLASLSANTTKYTDNTTASRTSYTYRVRASNAAGFSAYSNPVLIKSK